MIKQRNISFWVKSLEEINSPLLSLQGESSLSKEDSFDVAIIGGGLTGLWLAYYLQQQSPTMKIAIFEQEQIGYGASGRNGGWLSREVPIEEKVLKKKGISQEAINQLYQAMQETVKEVDRICQKEAIKCDLKHGGILSIAINPAQVKRLEEFGTDQYSYLLTQEEAQARVHIPSIQQAHFDEIGARIHPLKLLLGLKKILIERGVKIYENHPVRKISPQMLVVDSAGKSQAIQAQKIVTCTEAYSKPFLDKERVIPINSSIIVTEVISPERWEKIGWSNYELLADNAHLFFYAQRTFDNRILIGGRGSPYQFGAKDAGNGELDSKTAQMLLNKLHSLFPQETFTIEYAWKGSIGVSRDWTATVSYDDTTKIGHIYGFVGSGVTTTNLAARTMADRLLEKNSALTKLPWNDHQSPVWEPEPLKWIAAHSLYAMLGYADAKETKKQLKDSAFLGKLSYKIAGRS